MPYYVLPPVLFNTVCAFHESLPASARALFETDFYTRLELMPHPEQSNYDQSPTFDLIPATPGVGHLDAISHWFFLGLLVDGTGGALKAAETADDRAKVLEVARLYLRWLDGDYPSHGEWQAITDEEKNPMPETPTNSYYTAWMLAELGTDNCTFVSSAMSFAATNHYGKKLPIVAWWRHPWLGGCLTGASICWRGAWAAGRPRPFPIRRTFTGKQPGCST